MELSLISREEAFQFISAMPDGREKDEAAAFALEVYGPAPPPTLSEKFEPYQFTPENYLSDFLKWDPWKGLDEKHPGQNEVLKACARSIKQQIEKREFDKGNLTETDLTVWKPGDIIQNWFRIESGNGIGKTKLLSGAVQWFFDCFDSVVYTFHTSATQDEVTTWAEIGQDRAGKDLPGRILKTKLELSANRFAMSRTTSDSGGTGEERTKGKHKPFLGFVVDEADGIENYVFKAIKTMASGGISLVIMTANPRSRSSPFHRLKRNSYVKTFRISSLYHPNVVQGKEVIPGAVMRDFIEKQMEEGCQIVHLCASDCSEDHKKLHIPDKFTFELPYTVLVKDQNCPPGTIFQPDSDFMTTVLGITPPTSVDKTVISAGVYESAKSRVPEGGDVTVARVGVDAARSGVDKGTVYFSWQDVAWRSAQLSQADTPTYVETIKTECLKLKAKGVTSLHIRVDAGYGSGVIDGLKDCAELIEAFEDFQVFEVHFGGKAYNIKDYDNIVTEMYYETAESLKGITLIDPPEQLEIDLTEREYKFVNRAGKTKKILEPKEDFKKRTGRSPDDGDGLVLAIAPDYCFQQATISVIHGLGQTQSLSNTTAVDELDRLLGITK